MSRIAQRAKIVLVAAGILVIGLLTIGCRQRSPRSLSVAKAELAILRSAWSGYLKSNSNVHLRSVTLGKLQRHLPADTLIPASDPWGAPYQWRKRGVSIEIFSTGPDKIPDTGDDLKVSISQP